MFAPDSKTPNMNQLPSQTPSVDKQPVDSTSTTAPEGNESDTIIQNLEAHLDQLNDNDKSFLGEHLTPEFVRAIGLINGPEVAQYLSQFVDPNKVLVPVPRQLAEEYLAGQKGQSNAPAQPSAPTPTAPPQGQQGLMAPNATATFTK